MKRLKNMKKMIIAVLCVLICTPWCIAEEKAGPVMTLDSIVYDFGKIKQNTGMNFDFSFYNSGDSPLMITQYQTFCDCTSIEEIPEIVEPGEKGIIKGVFNSKDYKGEVERMIKVVTNEKLNETHILIIKADVMELIKIEPQNTMMFPHEAKDGIISKEIIVESVEGLLFEIKEIKSKVDFLTSKVIIEEEKEEEKNKKKVGKKKEEQKMKDKYNIQVIVDPLKIPDFGFFYIAVELIFHIEIETKGTVELKTMILIFNDQTQL